MRSDHNSIENRYSLVHLFEIPEGHVAVVGSVLMNGAGRDLDLLALVPDLKLAGEKLEKIGFELDPDADLYESLFVSYRKHNCNILLTAHPMYYASEVTIAHSACVAHRPWDLSTREGRVSYHKGLRESVRQYVQSGE